MCNFRSNKTTVDTLHANPSAPLLISSIPFLFRIARKVSKGKRAQVGDGPTALPRAPLSMRAPTRVDAPPSSGFLVMPYCARPPPLRDLEHNDKSSSTLCYGGVNCIRPERTDGGSASSAQQLKSTTDLGVKSGDDLEFYEAASTDKQRHAVATMEVHFPPNPDGGSAPR
jgi:hypothetical protein